MSTSFEIEGRLAVIDNTVEISASFKKREFVIYVENERNAEWSDNIKFQLVQDKCDLIDSFNVGDTAKVSFNLKGRAWEKDGKTSYFNSLDAWRIDKVEGATASAPAPSDAPDDEDVNNLPF